MSSARSARPATPSRWRARWTRSSAGDLIVFRTAGAYGATMSSGYNSRPLTAEVLVNGDRWALVRRPNQIVAEVVGDAAAGVVGDV